VQIVQHHLRSGDLGGVCQLRALWGVAHAMPPAQLVAKALVLSATTRQAGVRIMGVGRRRNGDDTFGDDSCLSHRAPAQETVFRIYEGERGFVAGFSQDKKTGRN